MQDKMLNEIQEEIDFLTPYLKQFKNRLIGNKVLEINSRNKNKLTALGFDLYYINEKKIKEMLKSNNFSTLPNEKFNGISIINPLKEFSESEIIELLMKVHDLLTDEGYLFMVNNSKYYDKETIMFFLKKQFILEEEFIGDDSWNFFLYKKNTIK